MPNQDAISKAFKDHYPSLVLYAMKWVKEQDVAKDAVQSVFTNLLGKGNQLKVLDFRAYLFQSVRNQCINFLKKESSKFNELKEDDIKDYGYFNDPIEEAEFEAYVFKLIDTLPPATKNIFKLNRFEGLSNREISEKLDISKRTVELQISNALKLLRGKIFDPKNPKTDFHQFLFLLL